jgi:hypothetical protein
MSMIFRCVFQMSVRGLVMSAMFNAGRQCSQGERLDAIRSSNATRDAGSCSLSIVMEKERWHK